MSRLLAMVLLILIGACGDKVTVCGSSGGVCCGVAYSADQNGGLTPTVHQCVPSCNQCPPSSMTGSPVCPVENPPGKSCEVKREAGWIWEQSSALTALRSTLDSASVVLATPPVEIQTAQGGTTTATQPEFCKLACETGEIRYCPRAEVPNDVSFGLLSLVADTAEAPPSIKKVITIKEVIALFNVSAGLGSECTRSDVIINKGNLFNSGSDCGAAISTVASTAKLAASLHTPKILAASTKSSPGIADFADPSKSFSLTLGDAIANAKYGGPIGTAARTTERTEIATAIDGSKGRVCVAISSPVLRLTNFNENLKVLSSNPDVLSVLSKNLRAIVKSSSPAQSVAAPSGQQKNLTLMPLSQDLQAALADPAITKEVISLKYYGTGKYAGHALSAADLLLLVDAYRCSKATRSFTNAQLVEILPPLPPPEPERLISKGSSRDVMAGNLLLCRFGGDAFSASVGAAIDDAFPVR